jgi:predicted kinase
MGQVTLNAAQAKKLAALAKKTGYDIEALVFDAIHWYLETKAPTLTR